MTLGLLPNFVNTAALRYFYEVARYGSFRLAAEKVHIAASAISRQIQLLEQELDVKLFTRRRSGLILTPAGEALIHRVKRAMQELSSARSEIDALRGVHRGKVRIGVNETVAREFFAAFLVRFREQHPYLQFAITVGNSDDLETALLRGDLEIIIGYAVRVREGIHVVVAYELAACITVPIDHALAGRKWVRVADFVDEPIIMPSEGSTLRHVLNSIFSKVSVRPSSTLSTGSFEFMASLVAAGYGVGCQLRLSVGRDPIRQNLVYVPIQDADVRSATLACCIPDEGLSSTAASVSLDSLRIALDSWLHEGKI